MVAHVYGLTVKGESIERIFLGYTSKIYKANRRYQRKLVWGIEEKRSFIDSILQGFPVPIILLAEDEKAGSGSFEIIDGMQRLNAVMAFIENDFSIDGGYFDLNSMASTKQLLDVGALTQKMPVLDRHKCVQLVGYELPVSIFEFEDSDSVDEVFRRINSGGRKLSRQELRSAGSVGDFATAVRRISANVRGDASHQDILPLNEMKNISIAGRDLGYGIPVEGVFWVAQGVLTKEDVRQSLDEQLVADLLAYMVLDNPPASRSDLLDDYFGLGKDDLTSTNRMDEINRAIQKRGAIIVENDFAKVIDVLKSVVEKAGKPLTSLLFDSGAQPKAPRVFQVVFLALHELIVRQNKALSSIDLLARKMKNSGAQVVVQEGGKWGADHRQKCVDSYAGIVAKCFKKSLKNNPSEIHWITQFENILAQSFTEQNCYDFKQGFLLLSAKPNFDNDSFEKILQTCSAIANISSAANGYVLVGISDKDATTARVQSLFAVNSMKYNRFDVLGVEHEAKLLGKTLDEFFKDLVERVRRSELSESLRLQLLRDVKLVRYYDKAIFVLEVRGQADPSSYGDNYYVREGANLRRLEVKEHAMLFKHFYKMGTPQL